jgi:hypothetical protein
VKSCEEILDVLPDHLPRLSGEALEVHEHLRRCHTCSESADEAAHTLHVLATQAEAAPALGDDFAERVMGALPAGGAATPAGVVVQGPWVVQLTRAAAALLIFTLGVGAARVIEGPRSLPGSPDSPSPERLASAEPDVPRVAGQGAQTQLTERPGTASYGGATPVAYGGPSGSLEQYVSEAGLVLRAVNALERPDPRWLDAMALHIHEAALLEQGEQLLLALDGPDREPQLRRLISGTQMLLLKLRNARSAPASVRAVRLELRDTGILKAYDALLTTAPADEPPPQTDPTDPL